MCIEETIDRLSLPPALRDLQRAAVALAREIDRLPAGSDRAVAQTLLLDILSRLGYRPDACAALTLEELVG
ncbi:hypothetical protein KAJ83_09735 [Marivibrio halodurans]|uniref:Uncharacterized protein n=1 Tax=Marivibrio halodurans TaxID=2039722 RepID=A0A8J7S5S6_9PROT|nr:hypothetical protein [Marivibrio halodurans]MBP5857289.1 hypothetical protein [Marivibrio halodurans]